MKVTILFLLKLSIFVFVAVLLLFLFKIWVLGGIIGFFLNLIITFATWYTIEPAQKKMIGKL